MNRVETTPYLMPNGSVASVSLKEQMKDDLEAERKSLQVLNAPVKPVGMNVAHRNEQFKFRPIGDVVKSVKPIEWTVEGVMEFATLSLLFGDPASYKSFLALDWALSIGTGTRWNGHQIKQGPVFIFIGEGHNGYGRRIKAWMKGKGMYVSDAPIFISDTPVQVLDPKSAEAASKAIQKMQKEYGKPALVLFDTLARNFGPGDENSTADMTRFVSVLDSFIDKDITRLLVHHTGHGDKQRSRGSSALKAALDAEYHLERNGEQVTLHCRKMKDAQEFQAMSFEPEIIDIGTMEVPMTSLYLRPVRSVQKTAVKLSHQMGDALSLLKLMGDEKCIRCYHDWRELCVEEKVYTRTSFYKAAESLEDKGFITITDSCVELSSMY